MVDDLEVAEGGEILLALGVYGAEESDGSGRDGRDEESVVIH